MRPVFIWGAPGIGKSSLVELFACQVGLPCVSLLGSQLAPEDLIGVPQIVDGTSHFCPARMIAQDEPYCLFLDELNTCSHEVQKAFYAKALIKDLAAISLEMAQMAVSKQGESESLPSWFLVEIVRDLARLVKKKDE